ncbi:MAG: hypothetical protein WC655_13985 [Candidatus Hydrogenedentales bacterium]|jgi:hypothetical protein
MSICAQTTSGQLVAGKLTRQRVGYHARRAPSSKNHDQRTFLGCNSAPAVHPAGGDSTALGLLCLTLAARAGELSARQTRRGWALAEMFLRQFVETKYAAEVAR